MGTVRQLARALPPGEKRQRIFEAARQVIVERGFDAAKMEEIAARAGVGKGTLYNFFDSKEELFLSLVVDSFERTRAMIDAQIEGIADPWERLEVAWRALMLGIFPDLVQQWGLNYQLWGFMARNAEARARLFAYWREMYREREAVIAASIAEGQASGHFRGDIDPNGVALLVTSIFDGLLHRAMFDAGRVDPEGARSVIVSMLRHLLTPTAEGGRQ
jgi:AcrR family transcriptional regulator